MFRWRAIHRIAGSFQRNHDPLTAAFGLYPRWFAETARSENWLLRWTNDFVRFPPILEKDRTRLHVTFYNQQDDESAGVLMRESD